MWLQDLVFCRSFFPQALEKFDESAKLISRRLQEFSSRLKAKEMPSDGVVRAGEAQPRPRVGRPQRRDAAQPLPRALLSRPCPAVPPLPEPRAQRRLRPKPAAPAGGDAEEVRQRHLAGAEGGAV